MKKTILQLSVAVMICVFGIVGIGKAETLYQRYLEVEGRYPTLQERAEKAFECGVVFMVKDYTGSFKQNIELIKCLPEEGMLGANPVTGFKKTLSSSMTSNQTTVPLSSVTTKDSITLTMALLGNEVYLSIEPGASKEEIVRCTVLTSTTFSSCTRGLGFSGTSTSAVTGNNKSHNSGSTVIMSNVQYVYNTTSRANTWTAKQTFTASTTDIYGDINLGAGSTDFDKTIFANNGDTNLPFLQYDEATSKWLIADDGINTFTISDGGSGLNASNTKAIFVTDSLIGINLVVDNGLEFSNGYLTVSTSSTIVLEGGNLAVETSTAYAWTGEHSFSATTTLATTTIEGNLIITNDKITTSLLSNFGDGSDGAVTISGNTTLTADMFYTDLTIDSGVVLTPDGYKIHVLGTLTNNGTIRANGVGGAAGNGQNGGAGGAGASSSGTLPNGVVGSAGGNSGGGVGGAGAASNPCLGVAGTAGNNGYGDNENGGAGGACITEDLITRANTIITTSNADSDEQDLFYNLLGFIFDATTVSGGAGGGGGATHESGGGGGGGGGTAGFIYIVAKEIDNTATGVIEANGGDGGTGGHTGMGDGGSGAGGAGGVIALAYESLTDNGTIQATHGSGGGNDGNIYKTKLKYIP